jgi:tryptophan-rich sensory protein
MDRSDILKLVISIAACLAAGGVGSIFTIKAIPTWYAGLKKPRYTPPNRAFGPIWTTLYILMAVSVFLVWSKGLKTSGATVAFILFWTQLVFNALWSAVFFRMRNKGGGVFVIVVLWCLILAILIESFKVSYWAGALLVPYLAWVTVAAYLNIGVWLLNKAGKKEPAG